MDAGELDSTSPRSSLRLRDMIIDESFGAMSVAYERYEEHNREKGARRLQGCTRLCCEQSLKDTVWRETTLFVDGTTVMEVAVRNVGS